MLFSQLCDLRSRTSVKTVAILSAFVIVVLTAIGVLGLRESLLYADQRTALVLHSRNGIGAVRDVRFGALQVEHGIQAYVITGDVNKLNSVYVGSDRVTKALAKSLEVLGQNPEHRARLFHISELFSRYHKEVSTPVLVASHLHSSTQKELVNKGSSIIREISDEAEHVVSDELAVLQGIEREGTGASAVVARLSTWILVVVAIFGAVLMLVLIFRLSSGMKDISDSADRIAGGDLSGRVNVHGNRELADLARSFNRMAAELECRSNYDIIINKFRYLLHTTHNIADVQTILSQLGPLCMPGTTAILYLLNSSKNLLVPTGGWGTCENHPLQFTPTECWSFRVGHVHEMNDARFDVTCEHARGSEGPTACIPLLAQGETVGVLFIDFRASVKMPAIASDLAAMLGLTIANLRLTETIQHQASTDPLTGLFNRRYLDETIGREFARADRNGSPLSIVVFDVDHFKRFNDDYSHSAGDLVLKEVGASLISSFRTTDIVCRYGGEEFLVLMPDCDAESAAQRADVARKQIGSLSLAYEGQSLRKVTISAGVASFPKNAATYEALIQVADNALYVSKKDGRNRVTTAARGILSTLVEPAMPER